MSAAKHYPHKTHLWFAVQVVKQALTVSNPGRAVAHVTFTSSHPAVTLQPTGATVVAGGEEQIEVVITGSQVGQVQAELVCSIEHGNSQVVSVMATVTGTVLRTITTYTV